MKQKEKKTQIKETMEEMTTSRWVVPLNGIGVQNTNKIEENREAYNLSHRGSMTSRRLYEKSQNFTVRDVDLYI